MPFFFLMRKNNLSFEQPSTDLDFDLMMNISSDKNETEKKSLIAERDYFSGISMVTFNGKFINEITLKLLISNINNPQEIIREELYDLDLDFLYSTNYLSFNPIKESKNNKYNVNIEVLKQKEGFRVTTNPQNSNEIAIRPLYFENKILNNLYYRISQYKPLFLKGPALPCVYILLNIILVMFIFQIINIKNKN